MVQNKYSTVQWFCIVKNYFNFISHNAHCCNWELSRYIKFQLEFLESIGPFHLPSLKKSFEMVRFKCNMVFSRLDKYVVYYLQFAYICRYYTTFNDTKEANTIPQAPTDPWSGGGKHPPGPKAPQADDDTSRWSSWNWQNYFVQHWERKWKCFYGCLL